MPELEGPVVLFYGDSFVAGSRLLEPGTRVSDALERVLGGPPVYNYAGSGYGVDQIVLRLWATHRLFARPTLVIGALPTDLDRSVLSFRSGAKPYFDLVDGALVLRGVPILLDPTEYVRRHPPDVRSYLFSYARQQARRLAAGGDLLEIAHRRDEKVNVNRALIALAAGEARERGLSMLWVLFQSPEEFDRMSWREEFLTAEFRRHDFRWLDTREVIRSAAVEAGQPVEAYFFEDGHPNELGNQVVGEALALALGSL